jgi:MFS family permease
MPDRIPKRQNRLLRLVGVEQYRQKYTTNTLREAASRLWFAVLKLPVFLTCLFYFFDVGPPSSHVLPDADNRRQFGWTIGNNTCISIFVIPAYNFDFLNLAALYVAPVVGAVLGLLVGYFLFDLIEKIWARYHKGVIAPENRLVILWLVLPFKLIGYNLIGATLENSRTWSFWVLAVGWGLHNFATVVTTSAVGAYLLDAYPEAAGECAGLINFARTLGGFIVGYVGACRAYAP